MLKGARVVFMFVLSTVGAGSVGAQDLAQLCQSAAHVTVGQWASYTHSGAQDDGAQVRFAIVSTERRGDSTLLLVRGEALRGGQRLAQRRRPGARPGLRC